MKIISTSDVADESLEQFRDQLRGDLDVDLADGKVALLSLEPPSWVSLLAETERWQQGLAAAAALYVAELLKEGAKETWRSRSKAIAALAGSTNRLAKLAASVVRLKQAGRADTSISISLPEPDAFFAAKLPLSASDFELTQLELALFVHHLSAISRLIETHRAEQTRPLTGYFLSLLTNGDLQVSWFEGQSLEPSVVLLPFSNDAV